MKEGVLRIALFLLVVLVATFTFKYFTFSTSTDDEKKKDYYQNYVSDHYKVFALELPDTMDFVGEEVPLSMNDVKERLDREMLVNVYWQSQTLLFYKRANKYFPTIEPILKENGVPDDFKYLALTESGLANVVSPAGATGYWQFLKKTGIEYGLEVNGEVDERYHLEKATLAFCKYMNDAHEKFNSWTLAAASYNMGMGGLNNQITRQKASNYYDLLLNEETGRYVFRILAVKEILSNPTNYGFYFRPQDLYAPDSYRIIEVDHKIDNLADFAFENGINYKILKLLNPWLRDVQLTNSKGKNYQIKIPTEGYYSITQQDSIH